MNYFVATGMNSKGIVGAGGIGKYMAEWIIDGQPSLNLWAYDIRRFVGHHNNKRFLRDRMQEAFGKMLDCKQFLKTTDKQKNNYKKDFSMFYFFLRNISSLFLQ